MPHDLPPWEAAYQQTQRWIKAGVFEEMVHDLRLLLRLSKERASEPSATVLDVHNLVIAIITAVGLILSYRSFFPASGEQASRVS